MNTPRGLATVSLVAAGLALSGCADSKWIGEPNQPTNDTICPTDNGGQDNLPGNDTTGQDAMAVCEGRQEAAIKVQNPASPLFRVTAEDMVAMIDDPNANPTQKIALASDNAVDVQPELRAHTAVGFEVNGGSVDVTQGPNIQPRTFAVKLSPAFLQKLQQAPVANVNSLLSNLVTSLASASFQGDLTKQSNRDMLMATEVDNVTSVQEINLDESGMYAVPGDANDPTLILVTFTGKGCELSFLNNDTMKSKLVAARTEDLRAMYARNAMAAARREGRA